MRLSKLAIATATSAALTTGTVAVPAADAQDAPPQGGSAMWLYQQGMQAALNGLDGLRGNRHPSETFIMDMLLLAPLAILAFPLQMIAEAELRLSSQFGL